MQSRENRNPEGITVNNRPNLVSTGERNFHVAGLGNALVDALVRIDDDSVIEELGFDRGRMSVVDDQTWQKAYSRVSSHGVELQSGGSCANSIAALGLLGAKAVYCGQIGSDDMGRLYEERIREACGQHALKKTGTHPTGKCLSIISGSDAERTMLTNLGAAVTMTGLTDFEEVIRGSHVLHLTAYLLLDEPMRSRAYEAIAVANQEEIVISLDVADPFVISVAREPVVHILDEFADIVFMNADEASALCDGPPENVLDMLADSVDTIVLKLGAKGSIVQHNGERIRMGIQPVTAVDTTGAGDAYAAGFLYGYVHGWSMQRSAHLGSHVASLTVGQMGAVVRSQDTLAKALSKALDL